MNDAQQGKTERAIRFRERFVLQGFVDALSYAEDVPVRIIDIQKCKNINQLIDKIIDDEEVQALWERKDRKLSEFRDIAFPDGNYLTFFKYLTTEIFAEIFNQSVKGGENDIDISEDKDKFTIIIFLLPYIEFEIWRTVNSYSPPFHYILRMNQYWRLMIVSWYIANINENKIKFSKIDDRNNKSESAFNLADIVFNVSYLLDNDCALISGPHLYDKEGYNNKPLPDKKEIKTLWNCYLAVAQKFDENFHNELTYEQFNSIVQRKHHFNESRIKDSLRIVIKSIHAFFTFLEAKNGEIEYDMLVDFDADHILMLGHIIAYSYRYQDDIKGMKSRSSIAISAEKFAKPIDNKQIPYIIIPKFNKSIFKSSGHSNTFKVRFYERDAKPENVYFLNIDRNKKTMAEKLKQSWFQYFNFGLERHKSHLGFRFTMLREWIQREAVDSDQWKTFAHQACDYISRLMRADICTSIYRVDYANKEWKNDKLDIVAEFSGHPALEGNFTRHREEMETDEVKKKRGEISIAYKAFDEEEIVIYEDICKDLNENENLGNARLEYIHQALGFYPQSAIVAPMYIEKRISGLIEIKGSQRRHFNCIVRAAFPVVASILGGYLHHIQLIDDNRKIAESILDLGAKEQSSIFGDKGNLYQDSASTLTKIFMASDAHIWLRRTVEDSWFIFGGAAIDESREYFKSRADRGKAFKFQLDNKVDHYDITTPLFEYFIPIFNQDTDTHPYMIFRYEPDIPKTPVWDKISRTVVLGNDWVNEHQAFKHLRYYVISKLKAREILIFPIIDNHDNSTKKLSKIKGFVEIYHKKPQRFSPNWLGYIRMVNKYLVLTLRYNGFLRQARAFQNDFFVHGFVESYVSMERSALTSFKDIIGLIEWVSRFEKVYDKIRPDLINKVERQFKILEHDIDSEIFKLLNDLIGLKGKLNVKNLYDFNNSIKNSETLFRAAANDMSKNFKDMKDIANKTIDGAEEERYPEEINVIDMVGKSIVAQQKRFAEKHLHIDFKKNARPLLWNIDQKQFKRIINLILDNIEKYASRSYPVTVEFDPFVGSIFIENCAPYDHSLTEESIFKKGKQGTNQQYNVMRPDGNGIGMFIAKKYCIQNGIEINFHQERDLYSGDNNNAFYRFILRQ